MQILSIMNFLNLLNENAKNIVSFYNNIWKFQSFRLPI